jgi:hypothetical protein
MVVTKNGKIMDVYVWYVKRILFIATSLTKLHDLTWSFRGLTKNEFLYLKITSIF